MNRAQIEDLAKTLPRHECDDCGRSLAAVLSECPGCWGLLDEDEQEPTPKETVMLSPTIHRNIADLIEMLGREPASVTCYGADAGGLVVLSFASVADLQSAAAALGVPVKSRAYNGRTWVQALTRLAWCELELSGPHSDAAVKAGAA